MKCECGCAHVPDYGACNEFTKGFNGRCVHCDHAEGCHPGDGPYHNGPLGPIPRSGHEDHWNKVIENLGRLYELYCRPGGKEVLLQMLDELVAAYDKWLD